MSKKFTPATGSPKSAPGRGTLPFSNVAQRTTPRSARPAKTPDTPDKTKVKSKTDLGSIQGAALERPATLEYVDISNTRLPVRRSRTFINPTQLKSLTAANASKAKSGSLSNLNAVDSASAVNKFNQFRKDNVKSAKPPTTGRVTPRVGEQKNTLAEKKPIAIEKKSNPIAKPPIQGRITPRKPLTTQRTFTRSNTADNLTTPKTAEEGNAAPAVEKKIPSAAEKKITTAVEKPTTSRVPTTRVPTKIIPVFAHKDFALLGKKQTVDDKKKSDSSLDLKGVADKPAPKESPKGPNDGKKDVCVTPTRRNSTQRLADYKAKEVNAKEVEKKKSGSTLDLKAVGNKVASTVSLKGTSEGKREAYVPPARSSSAQRLADFKAKEVKIKELEKKKSGSTLDLKAAVGGKVPSADNLKAANEGKKDAYVPTPRSRSSLRTTVPTATEDQTKKIGASAALPSPAKRPVPQPRRFSTGGANMGLPIPSLRKSSEHLNLTPPPPPAKIPFVRRTSRSSIHSPTTPRSVSSIGSEANLFSDTPLTVGDAAAQTPRSSGARPGHGGEYIRGRDTHRMSAMESLTLKLKLMQTDYVKKISNLSDEDRTHFPHHIKMVALVKQENGEWLIEPDEARALPQDIPAKSVGDFKEKVKEVMTTVVPAMVDSVKHTPGENFFRLKETRSKMETAQSKKCGEMLELIDGMLSVGDVHQVQNLQKRVRDLDRQVENFKKETFLASQRFEEEMQMAIEKHEREMKEKNAKQKENIKKVCGERNNIRMRLETTVVAMERYRTALKNSRKTMNEFEKERATIRSKINDMKNPKPRFLVCKKVTLPKKKPRPILSRTADASQQTEEVDMRLALRKYDAAKGSNATDEDNEGDFLEEELVEGPYTPGELRNVVRFQSGIINDFQALEEFMLELDFDLKTHKRRIREVNRRVCAEMTKRRVDIPSIIATEMARLQITEREKEDEILLLLNELRKSHNIIDSLHGQVQRDIGLLQARDELHTTIELHEVRPEREPKEHTFGLPDKEACYLQLFRTLDVRQMELTRQRHMITLLERSNEQNHLLRVQQENKIGKMEEQIVKLRLNAAYHRVDNQRR